VEEAERAAEWEQVGMDLRISRIIRRWVEEVRRREGGSGEVGCRERRGRRPLVVCELDAGEVDVESCIR